MKIPLSEMEAGVFWFDRGGLVLCVCYIIPVLVTEAIAVMASVQSDDFDLVFCGGTCLSKAYGLVARMSEDVDFKIMQKNGAPPLSNSQLRARLSAMKVSVRQALEEAGFAFPDDSLRARDANRYVAIEIPYLTSFDPVGECLYAMEEAMASPEIQEQYTTFVADMVYGENPPAFSDAVGTVGLLIDSVGKVRIADSAPSIFTGYDMEP